MKKNSQNQLRIFGLHIVEVVAILAVAIGYLGGHFITTRAQVQLTPEITLTNPMFPANSTPQQRLVLAGNTLNVSWTLSDYWQGYSNYTVKIAYYKDDVDNPGEVKIAEVPAENNPNSRVGSYQWVMPPSAASYHGLKNPDDRFIKVYLIWKYERIIPITMDEDQSEHFVILPYRLIAPSGVTWKLGEQQSVRWSTTLKGEANIYVWGRIANSSGTHHNPIAYRINIADQSFNWKVGFGSDGYEIPWITDPTVTKFIYVVPIDYLTGSGCTPAVQCLPSGYYKGWDEDGIDPSQAIILPFNVNEPAPQSFIKVTAPTASDVWETGTAHLIKFEKSADIEYVDVLYSKDGGSTYKLLAEKIPNKSEYSWTPSSQDVSAGGMVKVADSADNKIYDESEKFEVKAPILPGITVGSPKGGDTWYWGDSMLIEYTATSVPSKAIKITLVGSAPIDSEYILAESVAAEDGTHTYTWQMNRDSGIFCAVSSAKIVIEDIKDDTIFGESGEFAVKPPLTFTNPADGTCQWPGALPPTAYEAGSTVTVTVAKTVGFNPSGMRTPALYYRIKVPVSPDYGPWVEIINGTDNFGTGGGFSYDWTVPPSENDYKAQLLFTFDTGGTLNPNNVLYFARSIPFDVTATGNEPFPSSGTYISAPMPLSIGASKILKSIDQFEATYSAPDGTTVGFMIGFLDASGNFIGENPDLEDTYGSFYNVTLGQPFNFNQSWLKDAASVKIRIAMATSDIDDPNKQPRVASAGISYTLGDKVIVGTDIMVTLTLVTPFEGQTYDYATNQRVHVIVYDPTDLANPLFNACYKIIPGGGTESPFIELAAKDMKANGSYGAWVKGIHHLAVSKLFNAPAQAGALEVEFTTAALIGDLVSKASTTGSDSFNLLNAQDWPVFLQEYLNLKEGLDLLADFNASHKVDVSDYSAFFYKNYGRSGAAYPLGSSFDKNICWPAP